MPLQLSELNICLVIRNLMQRVRFEDFRGFQDSGWLELRPITLLVGENSTGKTSFLSGLRYLLQAFERGSVTPFNREPYYLGGFSEIAHYRGGRGGRAKEFKLSIALPVPSEKVGGHQSLAQVQHSFTFGQGSTQPRVVNYMVQSENIVITFNFEEKVPKASIARINDPSSVITWSPRRSMPSEVIQDNSSYIRFLLDELMFLGITRPDRDEQQTDVGLQSLGLTSDSLRKLFRSRDTQVYGLDQTVFASAPVRTQPLRTYTPSEITLSSEGSHVPLELARIKARSQVQWQSVKNKLVNFGQAAHLFNDVDIKQFGKSDIDPFQLMFKINGPAMNVMDVGYGVSQVLPIVYQIQNPGRYSTFLLQQPEVHLHPRAQAELGSLISNAVAQSRHPLFVLETHSDYVLDRLRIEIKSHKLLASNVTVIFFKGQQHSIAAQNIFFDESGNMINPPDDLREFFLQEHSRLLEL